jgi:uncharacterized protein YcfL
MNLPLFLPSARLGLATAALLLAAGCATNVNTVQPLNSGATPNVVADRRVITDNTLARRVQVVSLNQATVSGNLLKVQATIQNLKNSVQTLNYKFEWVDQDGMAVSSPNETWKSIQLQGRETATISSVAVSPRAADFTLKLRE